jgi:hypothetical protein
MKIAYLLLADHSEALNGKTYAMGAGWNMLRFPQLPQEWSFSIALGIDVPWDATNQRHSLALHIEGPDGEHLGDPFTADFEAGRPPGAILGQDQRFVISLGTHQTFERCGPHAVVVAIDREEIDRSRFYVVQLQLPPSP